MNRMADMLVRDEGVAGSNPATPTSEISDLAICPCGQRTVSRTETTISPVTTARFWSKVAVSDRDEECWEWRGAKAGSGYGSFHLAEIGKTVSAHRVAFRLATGQWPPPNLLIRHKCDNPVCVNPFHLETGTHIDNARDMLDRDRQAKRVQAGERNYNSKLTAEQVASIRIAIDRGETNVSIGKRFGVHHATISRIRRGTSWSAAVRA